MINYVAPMLWTGVSQIFEADGSLRDIIVREISDPDWDKLISLSLRLGNVSYHCDGEDAVLPTSAAELLGDKEHAHCMKVNLGGPVVNAHFFSSEEIELDLDPREIGTQAALDKVLVFCSELSLTLERDVAITEESSPEAKLLYYSFQQRSWQIASH
ncbi:hypothetical protein [Pseudophaeobacter sp.]|uniref:hypothetical protein n=1 Tax=Pseudophaeobacter sp. TaxID=1971739 RepID=UPI004058A2C9